MPKKKCTLEQHWVGTNINLKTESLTAGLGKSQTMVKVHFEYIKLVGRKIFTKESLTTDMIQGGGEERGLPFLFIYVGF